jgi:hypothetical protein
MIPSRIDNTEDRMTSKASVLAVLLGIAAASTTPAWREDRIREDNTTGKGILAGRPGGQLPTCTLSVDPQVADNGQAVRLTVSYSPSTPDTERDEKFTILWPSGSPAFSQGLVLHKRVTTDDGGIAQSFESVLVPTAPGIHGTASVRLQVMFRGVGSCHASTTLTIVD